MNSLYIIGPVTGKPNDNKAAFAEARRALEADGYLCAIPHDYVSEGTDWSTAMRISITAMLSLEHGIRNKPAFDGVAMLDGWEQSEGARIEKQVAEALGIPCRPWREYIDSDSLEKLRLTDEERIEQLEQLAWNMWHFQDIVFRDLGIESSFTRGATGETWSVPIFREQLEALGVSLDG